MDLSSTDPETISSLLNGKVSVAHRLSEDVNPWPHVVKFSFFLFSFRFSSFFFFLSFFLSFFF